MNEDNYDDEQFEEDEVQSFPEGTSQSEIDEPRSHCLCSWKVISYDDVELGEQLGGGSMGLVHRGTYKGEPVAVKTLVSCCVWNTIGPPYTPINITWRDRRKQQEKDRLQTVVVG